MEKAQNAVAEGLAVHKAKPAKPKHLKTFHAKELHDGSYHVVHHSGHPKEAPFEHNAADLEAVHNALEEHMGGPPTEEEMNAPEEGGEANVAP